MGYDSKAMEQQAGQPGINVPPKLTTWDAITQDEKIERMRGIIKELSSLVQRLQDRLNTMEEHEHGTKGYPVMRLNTKHGYGELKNEKWF